jgi:hypothetical protein
VNKKIQLNKTFCWFVKLGLDILGTIFSGVANYSREEIRCGRISSLRSYLLASVPFISVALFPIVLLSILISWLWMTFLSPKATVKIKPA